MCCSDFKETYSLAQSIATTHNSIKYTPYIILNDFEDSAYSKYNYYPDTAYAYRKGI